MTSQPIPTENPLVLQPPAPVTIVAPAQAAGMVPLDDQTKEKLDGRVADFLASLDQTEVDNPAFSDRINGIHSLGSLEIKASASVSNRMLERPVQSMQSGLFDEGSTISQGLLALRNQVEELDPGTQDDLLAPRKLFGLIPFGNKLRDYFQRYQSAQTHINKIIESLLSGQDELRKDNAAIEQEKANLWEIMQKLEQYIYIGKKLDSELEGKLPEMTSRSPEKARIVREELVFYLRQKVQDLLTQLAVSVQGYLALDLVRKNNLELIKGVDRATTTTVSALRTAVIVAQALTNQKLVLDQITALNATTGNMIESTSRLLKSNTASIHEQAASSSVDLEKLKAAFRNIHETIDMISSFKGKALENMRQTIEGLSGEIEKSQAYLDRTRDEEVRSYTASLNTNELQL